MKGTLIVLEGTDGSGKSTQLEALCQRLERENIPFRRVEFPRYQSLASGPVRLYLQGAFGSAPGDVNAYAASAFYAVDRYASFKEDWERWYNGGGLVVCGRYTTSNAIHQASKLPAEEQAAFIHWLADFEFGKLGLPAPDLVLYLELPTELSEALRHHREQVTGTHADIHERDAAYQAACRESAHRAAELLGWETVSCAEGGKMRSLKDIHEELWRRIQPFLAR